MGALGRGRDTRLSSGGSAVSVESAVGPIRSADGRSGLVGAGGTWWALLWIGVVVVCPVLPCDGRGRSVRCGSFVAVMGRVGRVRGEVSQPSQLLFPLVVAVGVPSHVV